LGKHYKVRLYSQSVDVSAKDVVVDDYSVLGTFRTNNVNVHVADLHAQRR
jgi:hypothetical protein